MSSVASQILPSAGGNSGAPLRASTEPQSQQPQHQQQKSEPNTPVFHQQQQSQPPPPPPQQQQQQQLFPKPQPTARPLDTGSGKSSLLSTAALHPSRNLSTTNTAASAAPAATIPHHQHSSSSNHSNTNTNFHPRFTRGEGVPEPRPTDVICGRGKMTASHPANRRFRELVDSHKASYQNSKRRDEKTRITCELVDQLRGEGRFVLFDPGTKLWYEVSEEYAREKVSHSLRSRSSSDHQRCASHTVNSISTSMSLLGNNNGNANSNVNANGESDSGVTTIAPRSSSALGSSVMAAPLHPGSGSSGHTALNRGSKNGSGSGIRAATPKKSLKPSGGPSRKKNGATNSSASKTLPHKAASSGKAKHSSSSSSSSSSLSLSSSTSGLDEIVRRLICDQQELLRGMIQKETERFTSAAVMGPPPQQPLPLSFRAEATAVSTLTASLPKLGGTTTTKTTKTESVATAMAMTSPTAGTKSRAPPVPNATGALAAAAAAAATVETATRAASESATPAPAGAPATVSAI